MSGFLYGWLHIIKRKDDFRKIVSFINDYPGIFPGFYVFINGPLSCKDGRVIGEKNENFILISSLAKSKEPLNEMVEQGLTEFGKAITFDELTDSELTIGDDDYRVIRNAKYFEWPDELEDYLEEINYEDFK